MHTFTKLVIEADRALVQGFLHGWCTARGMSPENLSRNVLWPQDWDVRVSSVLSGIVEALKPGTLCTVLVENRLVPPLLQALHPWSASLRVRSLQRIQGASFAFHYEIFDRAEAEAVRRFFASLPDGLRVAGDDAHEARHTGDGEGMYAPSHAFVARGKGTLSGALRDVLAAHERCRQHERVRVDEVILHLEPATPET